MTDKLQAIREGQPTGWQRTYREKNPWVKHIISSRGRAKRKGFSHTLTTAEIRELWFRDRAHELKRPSIDRIDNARGYSKENCRFIELSENIRLGNLGRPSTERQREASRRNVREMMANKARLPKFVCRCGKKVTPRRATQKFCSLKCASTGNQRAKK